MKKFSPGRFAETRQLFFGQVVKNYAKWDIEIFWPYPIWLDFLTLFHKFCPQLQPQKKTKKNWLLLKKSAWSVAKSITVELLSDKDVTKVSLYDIN